MQAKVIISSKQKKKYEFLFKMHLSLTEDEQQIESKFYQEWSMSKAVPQGKHYEIEVLVPTVKDHEHADKIHFHASKKNQKNFICWTEQISGTAEIVTLVDTWCAGTVYTMETGKDFAALFDLHNIKSDNFESLGQVLEDVYKISVIAHKYDFKNTK